MLQTLVCKLRLKKNEYLFLKYLCKISKNVYNTTLYEIKQHYGKTGKYLGIRDIYWILKEKPVHKKCHTNISYHAMLKVDEAYQSFFASLKLKITGTKPPKFLPKDGYFELGFPRRQRQSHLKTFVIEVPKHIRHKLKFKKLKLDIPKILHNKLVKQILIVPKYNAQYFEIHYKYEEKEKIHNLNKDEILGIDIGVNNFTTCLNSKTGQSFILDGRYLKSINRFYNKESSKLRGICAKQGRKKPSKRIVNMSYKRSRQIDEYLRQYINFIVKYCLADKIGNIVIGKGWLAQHESNQGKVNNQNFCQLPFAKFAKKLESKCQLYGINFIQREESYTSKCDHLAGEEMKHHDSYLGKRVKRGLFKSSTGTILNADVNGALGIILKSGIGNSDNKLIAKLSSGCVEQPCRIRMNDIHQTSAMKLVSMLTNASSI